MADASVIKAVSYNVRTGNLSTILIIWSWELICFECPLLGLRGKQLLPRKRHLCLMSWFFFTNGSQHISMSERTQPKDHISTAWS